MLSFIGARRRPEAAGQAYGGVPTPWGHDLMGPRAELPVPAVVISTPAYEAWRIEQGIPVQPFDLDDSTIPQEAFLERDAVSFTKGCFLGQELVCRIDSRGHVNRFLRRFDRHRRRLARARCRGGGRRQGRRRAHQRRARRRCPTGALGYVRREIDPPSSVELRWDGGTATAVVQPEPETIRERRRRSGCRRCRSVRRARRRPSRAPARARWRGRCRCRACARAPCATCRAARTPGGDRRARSRGRRRRP